MKGSEAEVPEAGRRGEIWGCIAAAVFAAFFLVTSIQIAARRPFWFDEIVTVLISGLAGPSKILQALNHVDNNMPVCYFLVVHWFTQLLHDTNVAARLPSALAMAAGMLITFDCARRLCDGLHGLIAISFLVCSYLPYYGYEARSYGIFFMLASLGLWIWLNVKGTWRPAVLFGGVLFLAIMFHYYAVLCLVPYAAWEATTWKKWTMPLPKLIAGVVAAGCAGALLLSQAAGAKRYSAAFWSPPTLYKLRNTFSAIFPDGLFLLALILIWIALAWRFGGTARPAPMEAAESIGWLSLSIPFAGYVLARLVTNAYVERYFIGMLPGVAVAFSCMVWRHFRETRLVSFGIVAILGSFGIASQLQTLRHPETIDPYGQQTQLRQSLQLEGRISGRREALLCDHEWDAFLGTELLRKASRRLHSSGSLGQIPGNLEHIALCGCFGAVPPDAGLESGGPKKPRPRDGSGATHSRRFARLEGGGS